MFATGKRVPLSPGFFLFRSTIASSAMPVQIRRAVASTARALLVMLITISTFAASNAVAGAESLDERAVVSTATLSGPLAIDSGPSTYHGPLGRLSDSTTGHATSPALGSSRAAMQSSSSGGDTTFASYQSSSSRTAAADGDIKIPGVPGAMSFDIWTKGIWKAKVPVGYYLRFSPKMQGYILNSGLTFIDSLTCAGSSAVRNPALEKLAEIICNAYHGATAKIIEGISRNFHPRCWIELKVLAPPFNTVVGVNNQWRCP